MILFFVSLRVWYRWSQAWLGGGSGCGCFGVASKLTGMNAQTEKLVSALVLAVMALCALPAFVKILTCKSKETMVVAVLASLWLWPSLAQPAGVIGVRGYYTAKPTTQGVLGAGGNSGCPASDPFVVSGKNSQQNNKLSTNEQLCKT